MVFQILKRLISPYFGMLFNKTFLVMEPVFSLFSVSKEDVYQWSESPLLPLVHAVLVILLFYLTVLLFTNTRKKSESVSPKNWLIDPEGSAKSETDKNSNGNEPYRTTLDHLKWANKIILWLFMTSRESIPASVEAWIQDLNEHLAKQKNHFGTLIFGLREGSALPALLEIKTMKEVKHEIHLEILLKSTEFGFLVAVQEEEVEVTARNYSAIVTQFECWYTAVLSRSHGGVALVLKPNDKKPSFHFNMKPLTKQPLKTVLPESVGQALQRAVLHTKFVANLTSSIAQVESQHNRVSFPEDGDVERSCCSGSEPDDDNITRHAKTTASVREIRSSSFGSTFDKASLFKRHFNNEVSFSEPGNRSQTPVINGSAFQEAGDTPRSLNGSLGSLNNITRTPSGRGPAKPIRLREKRLLAKVLSFDHYERRTLNATHCVIELDDPIQRKYSELPSHSSDGHRMTFDLSSRSSRLKLKLRDSLDSSGRTLATGTIQIDTVDTEESITIAVTMLDVYGKKIGMLNLVLLVLESGENAKSSEFLNRESRLPGKPFKRDQKRYHNSPKHENYHHSHEEDAMRLEKDHQQEYTKYDSQHYSGHVKRQNNQHGDSLKRDDKFRQESVKRDNEDHTESMRRVQRKDDHPVEEKRQTPRESKGVHGGKRETMGRGHHISKSPKREGKHQSQAARDRSEQRRLERDRRRLSIEKRKEKRRHSEDRRNKENRRKSDEINLPAPTGDAESSVKSINVKDHNLKEDASRKVKDEPQFREAASREKTPSAPPPSTAQTSIRDHALNISDDTDEPDVDYATAAAESALKDMPTKPCKEKLSSVRKAKTSTSDQTNRSSGHAVGTGSRFTNPTAISSEESDFEVHLSVESSFDSQEDAAMQPQEKPFFRTRSLTFKSEKEAKAQKEGKEESSSSMKLDTSEGGYAMNTLHIPQNNFTPVTRKKSSSMNKLFSRISRSKKTKSGRNLPIEEERERHEENNPGTPEDINVKVKRSRSLKDVMKRKKKLVK